MAPEELSPPTPPDAEPPKYRPLYDIAYDRGYLDGLRRAIIIRLQSRFGRVGIVCAPWLKALKEVAELEAFLKAVETVNKMEGLYALLPPEDARPVRYTYPCP